MSYLHIKYFYRLRIFKASRKELEEVLLQFGVLVRPKYENGEELPPFYNPEEEDSLYYDFQLLSSFPNIQKFNEELADLIPKISDGGSYQPSAGFVFYESDYKNAPFFKLMGTGNSSRAFIDSRKKKIDKHIFCTTCSIHSRTLLSPLEVNYSKAGKRLMVNVDQEYWVITEKFGNLLDEWKLTGYELEEVIDKSPNPQKLFRLIPTVEMPNWSKDMKFHYIDRGCPKCEYRDWVPLTFHYDHSTLNGLQTDFAFTKEYVFSGSIAYKPLLVSARFRNLIIENKISNEIINLEDKQYKSSSWFFQPITVSG